MKKTLTEIVSEVEQELHCNCDLDRWEPERSTGHSWVCRIHEVATRRHKWPNEYPKKEPKP